MAKIIRVLEHKGIIFKENECILVTLENIVQMRMKREVKFIGETESNNK